MTMEVWKSVVGYEDKYEVSSLGNIRSLPKKTRKGTRLLKPLNQTYASIELCDAVGGKKRFLIHRIVAIAFMENAENKPQVNHINGNKFDNRLVNLEWATRSENIQHGYDSGLNSCIGVKNSQCKLNESKVLEIYNSNLSGKELSDKHNVSQSTIGDIRSGRSWSQITGAINKRPKQLKQQPL